MDDLVVFDVENCPVNVDYPIRHCLAVGENDLEDVLHELEDVIWKMYKICLSGMIEIFKVILRRWEENCNNNLLVVVVDGMVILCLARIGEFVWERFAKLVCTTTFSVHKSVFILLAPIREFMSVISSLLFRVVWRLEIKYLQKSRIFVT